MTALPRTLVVGIGNTLRGDDGAGVVAAEEAGHRWPDRLEVVVVHQLVPELAERVSQVACVVFADASVVAAEVSVTQIEICDRSNGTHTWSPQALLALARQAFGTAPADAWLVEIPVAGVEVGETLTGAAEDGVATAVRAIGRLVGAGD